MGGASQCSVQGDHPVYSIRIAGHLDGGWSQWFDGLTVTPEPGGTTSLTGPVRDQPALYGLLNRIRDTGMQLISVNVVDPAVDVSPFRHDRTPG